MSLLLLFPSSGGGAVSHDATGALAGQGATVAGSANRFRALAASGALSGQGAIVDGDAARFRAFSSSGALAGQGSILDADAQRFRQFSATGELYGAGAEIAGAAARSGAAVEHAATGDLEAQGAILSGEAAIPSHAAEIIYGAGDDDKKRRGKTYLDLIYEAEDAALKARNSAIQPVEQPKPIEAKPAEVITVDESKALAYYESLRQQAEANLILEQYLAEQKTLAFLEAERLRKMQDDEDVFLLLAACGYTIKH